MVAMYNIGEEYGENPKTLGDWVKNFRLKKTLMKRKSRSGGNLRVCAILSTALMSAEFELRRRQQERFQKWLEFQTKINKNHELQPKSELRHHLQRHQKDKELVMVSNHRNHDDEENCKQSEEIANLWKCELSHLDNFMRSISSASKNVDQSIDKKSRDDTLEHDNSYYKKVQTPTNRVPIRRDLAMGDG